MSLYFVVFFLVQLRGQIDPNSMNFLKTLGSYTIFDASKLGWAFEFNAMRFFGKHL